MRGLLLARVLVAAAVVEMVVMGVLVEGVDEDRLPQAHLSPTGRKAADPVTPCSGGFSVRKAVLSPQGNPQVVQFRDLLTSLGGWSMIHSDFQAPCTGAYFFTFHALANNGTDFTLALMKEGEFQVTAYGSSNDYQQGSNSALLFLNVGERVYLELQDGSLYEHPYNEAYTSFSGFLVDQF